jgi:hypothetical protein
MLDALIDISAPASESDSTSRIAPASLLAKSRDTQSAESVKHDIRDEKTMVEQNDSTDDEMDEDAVLLRHPRAV